MSAKCPHHDSVAKGLEEVVEKIHTGETEAATVRTEIKHLIASNIAVTESVKELTRAVNGLMSGTVDRTSCEQRREYYNESIGKVYKHSDTNDKDLRDYACGKINAVDKRISEVKDGAFKTASIVTAVLFGVLSFIQWLITTMK